MVDEVIEERHNRMFISVPPPPGCRECTVLPAYSTPAEPWLDVWRATGGRRRAGVATVACPDV